MSWAVDKFVAGEGPITLRDRLGWWLEGIGSRIFGWAYQGSREEIRDAFEVPLEYCSPVQREVRARSAEFFEGNGWPIGGGQ
jgi:hypothetical protein